MTLVDPAAYTPPYDHALASALAGRTRYEDDGRTLVGDPAIDVSSHRTRSNVEWRLRYLDDDEIDDALADATVALFPYRQELDQSGVLLRALGSGVPAVAYDVGGIAEPVRRFGAGAVGPADDQAALIEAAGRLLSDPKELESARAGARRAASELTWDAAAKAHLALYELIVR